MAEINSIASILTLVIIAVGACAAVIQLRHMRQANQLQGLLTVLARVEDMPLQEWVDGTRRIIAEKMPDPAYRQSIVDGTYDRTGNSWLQMGNSYEWIGSLVRHRLIPEGPVLNVYRGRVTRAWELMEGIIALRRRGGNSRVFENFEYLYMRAKLEQERLEAAPDKPFPQNTPRAILHDPWAIQAGASHQRPQAIDPSPRIVSAQAAAPRVIPAQAAMRERN